MRALSPERLASAKTHREHRRDVMRAHLRACFVRHNADVECWADSAGMPVQKAHALMSQRGGVELQVADVETLPASVRADVVRHLAHAAGFELVERSTPEQVDALASDALMLARVAKDGSDVVCAYAEAIADCAITADEAARIEREATEAIEALTTLRARAQRAVKARVDGVVLRAVRR